MSSQIPYRFGYKNLEMTATEFAKIFPSSKERKPYLDQAITLENVTQTSNDQF
jgi:hypothetical protein